MRRNEGIGRALGARPRPVCARPRILRKASTERLKALMLCLNNLISRQFLREVSNDAPSRIEPGEEPFPFATDAAHKAATASSLLSVPAETGAARGPVLVECVLSRGPGDPECFGTEHLLWA